MVGMSDARAVLESALRARKLDSTLTTALPLAPRATSVASTGIDPLDACLMGGLPRGELSEVAGRHSSGRTATCLGVMAAATRRGELVALVDPGDRLDVPSAASAGLDLTRLLWVRGQISDRVHAGPGRDVLARAVDRAIQAFTLVLHAGGFGVVVLDLADVPRAVLARLPFPTWLRMQRAVDGRDTVALLLVPEPVARSKGGLTVVLSAQPGWLGAAARSRRLQRLDIQARVVSPRRRVEGEVALTAWMDGEGHARAVPSSPW